MAGLDSAGSVSVYCYKSIICSAIDCLVLVDSMLQTVLC